MKWMAAAGAASLLAGCSLAQESSPAAVTDVAPDSPGSPEGTCLDAGNLAREILARARSGVDLSVVDAKAVRSSELGGTYLVAIRFTGDPNEDSGVWASTSLDLGEDSVRSVDTAAVEVTTWPWALVSEPKIAVDGPRADAARACL